VSPSPVDQVPPSLGLEVLRLARAELAAGVRETRPNGSDVIDGYAPICERNGRPIRVVGGPWCARFVTELRRRAARALGLPDTVLRAAVAELVDDARREGTWRDVSAAEVLQVGDWLVMGRAGQDPRTGGMGHVEIVEAEGYPGYWTIGGNIQSEHGGDIVGRKLRRMGADRVVGWIKV
jgi:hypothetical protein